MKLERFKNLLRMLMNIDSDQLDGVLTDEADWVSFRRDPYRWLIHADDERSKAVWKLLMKREGRTTDALCECGACTDEIRHLSDCAIHNAPAMKPGPCSCGSEEAWRERRLKVA